MAITLDEDDPCATAAALRQAYANLIAGGAVSDVEFRAGPNGVWRRVSYAKADTSRLLALLREWEAKCAGFTGICRPRRFGISTGGRF